MGRVEGFVSGDKGVGLAFIGSSTVPALEGCPLHVLWGKLLVF